MFIICHRRCIQKTYLCTLLQFIKTFTLIRRLHRTYSLILNYTLPSSLPTAPPSERPKSCGNNSISLGWSITINRFKIEFRVYLPLPPRWRKLLTSTSSAHSAFAPSAPRVVLPDTLFLPRVWLVVNLHPNNHKITRQQIHLQRNSM